jgi:zinc protease
LNKNGNFDKSFSLVIRGYLTMKWGSFFLWVVVFSIFIVIFYSCGLESGKSFQIDYDKYLLDNGLEVVLHVDHSDPIVAVATLVHAGSNREKPGRTGFAHFFEHMSFNDSENVPRGANRKVIPEWGGLRNGGTWSDGTVYYEVVPKDAFEKILWIDSDRLGYMINTVTVEALEREKQVVKNEKRERVDNVPYGNTNSVIRANLYPPNHPYNWTVIGSLSDLQAATLSDVKEFYEQYYGANNATLVIAGDIDIAETKKFVEKWFGEIRRGPQVEPLDPMPISLDANRSLYHEDTFANLPEIRMVFPTVEQYHEDIYALQVLAEVLSGSKKAPLYQVIVEEKKLAPSVSADQDGMELGGEFELRVRANTGMDLDDVKAAIEEGLTRFEQNGVSEKELNRIKAQIETRLYQGVETILDKAFQLAIYNEYAGDPGYISVEAKRLQEVTREDVMKVFNKYIKNKNYVMTSFVPKGQLELAVSVAEEAEIYEEKIMAGAEHEEVSQGEEADYKKTPTKHDRSEPSFGERPLFKTPEVWQDQFDNAIEVYGIRNTEIPLVTFDLTLKGGHWLDPLEKAGVASFLADMLIEGTKNRTPVELEEAIGLLGADISVEADDEEMRFSATTLARNFEATVDLIEEMLLEPRWDEKEYERLKQQLETRLKDQESNPRAISSLAYSRLLYGENHILGTPLSGTPETTQRITLDDLKDYYDQNFSPSVATFHIVGDVDQYRVMKALSGFEKKWEVKNVSFPEYSLPLNNHARKVFFIDVPDAKQSVIRMGKLALSVKDDNYNNLAYANQIIGGGSSGRLFQLLRIEKGYTYGAYSTIGSTLEITPYTAYTSVRTNVTLASLQLMRDLYENYKATFTDKEMEITKNKVIKGNTRAFESFDAKLNLLRQMSKRQLPHDYVEKSQQELIEMSLKDFHKIIDQYMNQNQMLYLVVGDARTQLARVARLVNGQVTVLNIYGEPVN